MTMITARKLRALDAPTPWVNALEKAYPNGINLTEEGIWVDLIAKGFGMVLDWPLRWTGDQRFTPIIRNHTFTAISAGINGVGISMRGGILENVIFNGMQIHMLDLWEAEIKNVLVTDCTIIDVSIHWNNTGGITFQNCTVGMFNAVGYWSSEESMRLVPDGITIAQQWPVL